MTVAEIDPRVAAPVKVGRTASGNFFVYEVSYEYRVGRRWQGHTSHYATSGHAMAVHENQLSMAKSMPKNYRNAVMNPVYVHNQ